MANKLYAGFGRECVNPDFPVSLSGYGDNAKRPGLGRENTIYITCVAIKNDQGKIILIYTMDGLAAEDALARELREALQEAGCTVPGEQIYLCATHCHNCPNVLPGRLHGVPYRAFLLEKGVKAGLAALADLSAASMQLAKERIPNMTFVRHYIMEDGSFAGVNYGDHTKGFRAHAAEADETLVLLRLAREDKQDILMVNFQAHAAASSEIGRFIISPDWVGHMRNDLEQASGMLVAYYNGASGNQITRSFLPEEMHGLKFYEYGSKMAEHAMALLPKLQNVDGAEIESRRHMFTCRTNNAWDHMLPQADRVYALWQDGKPKEADALARSYGFSSRYQTWQIRGAKNRPESELREMNVFRVGSIGFITGTYEMSSTEGIYVRANSPFDTTFILSGNRKYIPTSRAYDMRTYEGDTAPYIRGTAEAMAEKYVDMLKEIQ